METLEYSAPDSTFFDMETLGYSVKDVAKYEYFLSRKDISQSHEVVEVMASHSSI